MNFKWNLEYENADDIPEGLRDAGAYVEGDDGKWKMADGLAKKTHDLGNLNKSKSAAAKEAREAKAKLKQLEEALEGRDIEDLEEALDELEALKAQKDDFEKGGDKDAADIRAELRDTKTALNKANRDLKTATEKLTASEEAFGKVKGELGSLRFERVFAEKAKEFGLKNGIEDLRDVAMARYKFDDDGEIVPVKDDGDDFETFMESKRANPIYTAEIKPGGMNTTNNPGAGGKRTYKRADFDKLSAENPAKAAEVITSVRKGEATLVD